jgi:hypothetical protein
MDGLLEEVMVAIPVVPYKWGDALLQARSASEGPLLDPVHEMSSMLWKPPRRNSRPVSQTRPWLEVLQSRCLLATFLVSNTLDSGPGSLRQALLDSNRTLEANVIQFAIGSGGQTIRPTSALPAIT